MSVDGVLASGQDAEGPRIRIRVTEEEGGLVVGLGGDFEGCEGYTGEPGGGSVSLSVGAPLSFTQEAVSCESEFSTACRVGTYDFRLDGTSRGDLDAVTFDDQLLRFSGSFCGPIDGACRAP